MATVLLIILYTLTFIVLIDRITKHSKIRLSRKEIALAYCFKVAMGILYGFVFKKFYGGDDTWKYFNDSLSEYNELLFQTGQFFKEIIPLDSFQKFPGFADGFSHMLDMLEFNALTKSLAVFNLFSLQNYYVDVVFFNLFSFVGSYLLFKLFANTWKEKRIHIYIAAFFIPSISFWLSGIRSDAFLLLAIGLSLYYFQAWMHSRKWSHLFFFLIGLIGTLVFRLQFFLVLVPFLLAWWMVIKFSWKPWLTFTSVMIGSLLLFFGSSLSQKFNMLSFVVQRQHEFLELKANTVFPLNRLEPHFYSFVVTFPQAALNTFFRPYIWEAKGPLQLAASAEVIFFWIIMLIGLKNFRQISHNPLTWFVLFFGSCVYLLIGYTVPFPGAIVRYKVLPELLFFLLLFPMVPFKLKKITVPSFAQPPVFPASVSPAPIQIKKNKYLNRIP